LGNFAQEIGSRCFASLSILFESLFDLFFGRLMKSKRFA